MTRDGEWEIVHKDQPRKFFCVEKGSSSPKLLTYFFEFINLFYMIFIFKIDCFISEPECENFFSEDLVISGRWYRESSSKGHRGDLKRISPEFAAGLKNNSHQNLDFLQN